MNILSAQMEQLRLMKEAQDKKREIEEILRIKQEKKRQKKRDSFALQETKRMEELQVQLIQMKTN